MTPTEGTVQLPTWLLLMVAVLPSLVTGLLSGVTGWFVGRSSHMRSERSQTQARTRTAVAELSGALRGLIEWSGDDLDDLYAKVASLHEIADRELDNLPDELKPTLDAAFRLVVTTAAWRATVDLWVEARDRVSIDEPPRDEFYKQLHVIFRDLYEPVLSWRVGHVATRDDLRGPLEELFQAYESHNEELQNTLKEIVRQKSSGESAPLRSSSGEEDSDQVS